MNLVRRVAVYSAAAILAAGMVAVVTQGSAAAHGTPLKPGSRTWLCFVDGLTPNGDIQPHNPACSAAVQAGGTTPLYNWFGVLQSNANGQTTGFIPDGKLCSGNNPTFAAYDAARNDWPVTHLTAGSTVEIDYSNWAKHPGSFFAYVTKDTWSPTRPLAWSDLESVPFSQVLNPSQIGGPGTNDGHYFWNATLPTGKTGRHIIYMRWVRSDSQENFFSCSDVVFDGGNGNVTGVGTGSEGSPSPGVPGLCTATFSVTSFWQGAFQGQVTVRAAGTAPVNGWTTSFTPAGGVANITQLWNGQLIPSGTLAVVRSLSYNRQVSGTQTQSFGFLMNGAVPSPLPTVTCSSP